MPVLSVVLYLETTHATSVVINQSFFDHLNFAHLYNNYNQDVVKTILEEGEQAVMNFA